MKKYELSASDKRRCKTIDLRLLPWFDYKGRSFPWRRDSLTNYQYVVTEVLLQRTRAETVSAIFEGFFEQFPDWNALAAAESEQLRRFLKPLGLWQRRAVTLHDLAIEMSSRGRNFPGDRNAVEELPGVGQYIANAIELLIHGKPMPLLDTNMARVIERYFRPRVLADIRYDPWLQEITTHLVRISRDPIKLNWAILDLGAMVCLSRKPSCCTCPLRRGCSYRAVSNIEK
ncbi:hypothetical protein ACFL3W_00165 [Pseudomonadota bacterium]